MKTVVVISTSVPPAPSGQAVVLQRLLRDYYGKVWFFTDGTDNVSHGNDAFAARHVQLRPLLFGLSMRNLPGALGYFNAHIGAMRPIRIRTNEILRELRNTSPDIVIACSGNPFDLPTAAQIARRTSAKFIAYLFDDPVFQWPAGHQRDIVSRLERQWSQLADHIICPNEALAQVIEARTNRRPIIVRNPIDSTNPASITPASDNIGLPVRILYTGAVSEAQSDALARLASVVSNEPEQFELHIHTNQSDDDLVRLNIRGSSVFRHPHIPQKQITTQQQQADILFLPLSLMSEIPEAVMTASPGKMGEYLASGRPILAHVPRGSFAAELLSKSGAAMVVDQPSGQALRDALLRLSADHDLRIRLVRSAALLAKNFGDDEARRIFWSLLDGANRPANQLRQTTRFTKPV